MTQLFFHKVRGCAAIKKSFPAVWCAALLLVLPGLAAQESEQIVLPDLSTKIDSPDSSVVADALPDFTKLLPKDGVFLPEMAEASVPVFVPSDENALPSAAKEKDMFAEAEIGGGYNSFFFGNISVYKPLGKNPFELNFFYESADGYSLHPASGGFSDSTALLRGNTLLTFSDTLDMNLSGEYSGMADGMQGKGVLFYNSNARELDVNAKVNWRLPRGFFLSAGVGTGYATYFFGHTESVAPIMGQNGIVAGMTGWNLVPGIRAGWRTDLVSVYADANYAARWYLGQRTELIHRGLFTLGADFDFSSKVPGLSAGVSVSAAVSNAAPVAVPFSAYAKARIAFMTLELSGGMRSSLTDFSALRKRQPFVDPVFRPVEESDWFTTFSARGAVSMFSFGASLDFAKTAFGNGALLPVYDEGVNLTTGRYRMSVQDRTLLNTDFFFGLQKNIFGGTLGVKSQWLYIDPVDPAHKLYLNLSVAAPDGTYGVSLNADFPFLGDVIPDLSLSGYYSVNKTVRFGLELTDMVKLFSGKERVFTAPFISRGGTAAIKIKLFF